MKSIAVYYFTGTGNTGIIAETLCAALTELKCKVDLIRMEDVLKGRRPLSTEEYDMIGLGCPVFGYTAPPLVSRFISLLPCAKGTKAFVFRTAGGVAPINYNTSNGIRRKLRRKGYDVFHERIFSISSNWIQRFDDDVVLKLHAASEKKTKLMAAALVNGETRVLKTGLKLRLLMGAVSAGSPLVFRFVGKDFAIGPACTKCGLCVRNCPAGNITEKGGNIRFGWSCNSCLRCIYACPQHAIRLRKFAFFEVSGGYDIGKILASPRQIPAAEKKPEPPFLGAYVTDDAL